MHVGERVAVLFHGFLEALDDCREALVLLLGHAQGHEEGRLSELSNHGEHILLALRRIPQRKGKSDCKHFLTMLWFSSTFSVMFAIASQFGKVMASLV